MGIIYELAKIGGSNVDSNKEIEKNVQYLESLASYRRGKIVIEKLQRNNHFITNN